MSENLCIFLEKEGWDSEIAEEIQEAFDHEGLIGVEEYTIEELNDNDNDFLDEVINSVKEWQIKVVKEWQIKVVKKRMFVIKQ